MTETYWDGQAWTEVIDHIEDTDWWNNEWECEVCYEEYERPPVQDDTGREVTVEKPVLVSLMDIAKPAKPKGVAREFEVVNGLSKVIACEEDVWHDNTGPGSSLDDFWEDWDNVYEDCAMEDVERPSYSSVARLRNSG
ncbi:hypothetical protein H0H93_013155 [Arthromyces matolae]|nr:hypothetical protein H0H93_013155 [Arthromyces matolae]